MMPLVLRSFRTAHVFRNHPISSGPSPMAEKVNDEQVGRWSDVATIGVMG